MSARSIMLAAAMALTGLLAPEAGALGGVPPEDAGDSAPRRVLARLDFEENEEFPREVPVGWRRVLSGRDGPPGFPDFGSIAVAAGIGRRDGAPDGGWAVRFSVDGASMALASEPGRVPTIPGAQLLATAWVRTKGLRHAGARISLQFVDAAGAPIGETHSSPSPGVRSESGWRPVRLAPPVAPEGTVGAVVWLEVVQPRSLRRSDASPFEISASDVEGWVDFDDVEIWQLPNVTFEAEGADVVPPAARMRLALRCSDPASPKTSAEIGVRDAAGMLVHRESLELEAGQLRRIALPALPAGWYEAEARLTSRGERVATRHARFAVLPSDPFEPGESPRFGIALDSTDRSIEPAVGLARAAFVVLPAWSAEIDVRAPGDPIERLRPLVSRLRDRGVEPVLRLSAVPTALALEERVDQTGLLELFAREESRWLPALEPWLLAFGQQVDAWILGDVPVAGDRPELAAGALAIDAVLRRAIAGPTVRVPWSPEDPFDGAMATAWSSESAGLEVVSDAAWRESALETYDGLPRSGRTMVRIVPMPVGLVDEESRSIDLALRAIDAWRAGFDAISLDVRADAAGAAPGPSLDFVAWRHLSTFLSGRRVVREIPLATGVRALLAEGPRGPALVVWNEAHPDALEIDVDLGSESVTSTDLWGRRSDSVRGAAGHRLRIGREPLFVEGLTAEACLLRAGFRIEPGFAPARRARQEAALVLANPWRMPLTGTIRVLAPEDLGLSPASQRFTVDPLGETRIPITFTVPRVLESGPVDVKVHVEGIGAEPVSAHLTAPLEVGFREVDLESSWRLARSIESGAIDLVLVVRVTNRSERVLDVEAFAVADGYTQTKKPVSGLAPGQSAVRVFRFAGGAKRLSGRDVRTGVQDPDGDMRLLRRVVIPPLLPPEARVAAADER